MTDDKREKEKGRQEINEGMKFEKKEFKGKAKEWIRKGKINWKKNRRKKNKLKKDRWKENNDGMGEKEERRKKTN